MKKLIIALLCLSSLLSCRKTDKSFKEVVPITSQSAQNQIEYANAQLKQITEGIAVLAKDKDFVSFVQTEAKKKFDGEYEVLIQDLQRNSAWNQKMNLPIINDALNAFKNIDGSNYYPQIYIPKFQHEEDMKAENNYIPTNVIDSPEVVYIYYSGDSEVDSATNENDSYAGYVLDSTTNQLVYWGMVNEEYANDNEVWIISLNESVGNEGNYCPPEFVNGVYQYCPESVNGCCGSGGGGGGGGTPPCTGPDCDPLDFPTTNVPFPDLGHTRVNFKIQNMIVRSWKESWLAGASEISIRAKLSCHNDRELGSPYPAVTKHYTSDQKSSYLGNVISKFKRREVKRQIQKDVQYKLQANWQNQFYQQDAIYFDYIIFEKDNWPARLQKYYNRSGRNDLLYPSNPPADNWDQWYRSSGQIGSPLGWEYNIGSFHNTTSAPGSANSYYNSGFVSNAYIQFNTIGY